MHRISEIINNRTFVISEAGVNHNGDVEIAKKLIDAAAEAKADAVKFQTFKAESMAAHNAEKAEYQKKATGCEGSQYEMLKKLELSLDDHIELYKHCQKKGIMFLSTPFDFESVDLLQELGVKMFKISSGDLTNMPLLKYIAKINKPIILSTGMADLGEIKEAVAWIQNEGNSKIILLHCTTNYPAAYHSVNLRALATIKKVFGLPVGYSDHTEGIETGIAAVAMGACIVEKHFTLDKKMHGPDHKASLEPDELKEMIQYIRNVEKAMGSERKICTPDEVENKKTARKSIITTKRISKGETIDFSNIAVKRPGTGIAPKYFDDVIGFRALTDLEKDTPLDWNLIVKEDEW